MTQFALQCKLRAMLLSVLALTALHAHAQTLLLDNFAAPGTAVSVTAASQNYVVSTPGAYAGVAGQLRDAYYWKYSDPSSSGATASIGNGAATAHAGTGAFGEYGLGYGSYGVDLAHPGAQGAPLGLDLSGYGELQAVFSHMDKETNYVVGLYTASPLPGGNSYWTGEIFVTPSTPGGSAVGNMVFQGGDAATFNFAQVDGLVVIFDRAAAADGNGYSLTQLQFTQAVPEPSVTAVMLAGLLVMLRLRARARAS